MRYRVYKKIVVFVLVISLITPVSFLYPNHRAQAQLVVSDPTQIALLTTISIQTAALVASENAIVIKEFSLDAIAFAIAKIAIKTMTASIVNWINSGFQGSPSFVTDLEGYLIDVADQVAGAFILGSELSFLCSPFELQIRLALGAGGRFEDHIQCRLTDVVGNIDSFLGGNFRDGGWPGWFQLSQFDNPYNRTLESKFELNARIANARFREVKKLEFGSGFLSFETCSESVDEDGAVSQECEIATPGVVIESQLENVLGSGVRQLELADEINEIVSALLVQLVTQVVGAGRGLLGSSRSSSNRRPFTERLQNDTTTFDTIIQNAENLEGTQGTGTSTSQGVFTQCSDGVDNDNDGFIDLDDGGCSSLNDNNESVFVDNPPEEETSTDVVDGD